jgi:hypothetical protein
MINVATLHLALPKLFRIVKLTLKPKSRNRKRVVSKSQRLDNQITATRRHGGKGKPTPSAYAEIKFTNSKSRRTVDTGVKRIAAGRPYLIAVMEYYAS